MYHVTKKVVFEWLTVDSSQNSCSVVFDLGLWLIEVLLQPIQQIWVMLSMVSLPNQANHTFPRQA